MQKVESCCCGRGLSSALYLLWKAVEKSRMQLLRSLNPLTYANVCMKVVVVYKLPLDLSTLLPDADDHCVDRLTHDLTATTGIDDAHVIGAKDQPRLCVHYDDAATTAEDVGRHARRFAANIQSRFGHMRWTPVELELSSAEGAALIDALTAAPGVVAAEAKANVLDVEFERDRVTADELMGIVHSGVPERVLDRDEPTEERSQKGEHDGHNHGHGRGAIFGDRSELIFAGLAGLLLLIGFLLAALGDTPRSVEMTLYCLAFFFGAFFTVQEAYENVRHRRFEIDSLMLVAAAGAAALGEVAEGAFLLFLFSIGHALEAYAMGRARNAIEALAQLAPKTALVRRDRTGETVEVPVDALRVGDVVVVRPNIRIAADGFVVAGTSSVDQAPVTGESVPVDKAPVGDITTAAAYPEDVDPSSRVFAGTINGAGAIEIQVTRTAADSTLSRVVRLVADAQVSTSSTQRFTDKFQRVFVPAILALVVLLPFAGLVIDEPFSDTVYRALAVLVAASPCALAIATPSAVLSAVGRAARSGILVKGGAPLEILGRVDTVAFDKTGTLTQGKPRIVDVVAAAGATEGELLTVAVAVEEQSDHPLARAIVRDASIRLGDNVIPRAQNVEAITGQGVTANVDGVVVRIGKRAMFTDQGTRIPADFNAAVDRLETTGRTTMVVRAGDRWLGAIGMMDTARPEAADVLRGLARLGVGHTVMISGDNQRVADAIAAEIGVQQARGDLMPEDKVTEIASLRKRYGRVAMVGDGVNDAPALANADVGIAMGAAGSDVALETADVALMADDLRALPFAVKLSRRSNRVIAQNLWASLGIVAVLLPATIFGLGIGPAVLIHEGSTLIVVANALRLLALRDREQV